MQHESLFVLQVIARSRTLALHFTGYFWFCNWQIQIQIQFHLYNARWQPEKLRAHTHTGTLWHTLAHRGAAAHNSVQNKINEILMQIWFVCKCSTLQANRERSSNQIPVPPVRVPSPKPIPIAVQCAAAVAADHSPKGCKCACPSPTPLPLFLFLSLRNMLATQRFISVDIFMRVWLIMQFCSCHQTGLPPHPHLQRVRVKVSIASISFNPGFKWQPGNRRRLVPPLNFTAGVKVPQLAAIKKGCNQSCQHEQRKTYND